MNVYIFILNYRIIGNLKLTIYLVGRVENVRMIIE